MENTIKTLMKYIGGKGRMCEKIESIIPEDCTTLVEPFAGSAVVSINCTQFEKTIVNDADYFIVNLLRTVADKRKGGELLEILKSMPNDKETFQMILKRRRTHGAKFTDEVHLAAESWFIFNHSFNARGTTFSAQSDTWKFNKLAELEEIIKNLSSRNIEIHHGDGLWFLQKGGFLRDSSCFVYLDPPYIAGVRSPAKLYRRDMPERENHILLLKAIRDARAKVVISGYDSKIYNEYLLDRGWHKYSLGEYSKGCDFSKERSKGTEIIWTNYTLGDNLPNGITNC